MNEIVDGLQVAVREAAHAALVEVSGAEAVGDFIGVAAEASLGTEFVGSVHFASALRGYRGWVWAVTVVISSHDAEAAPTVSEVVLLPGEGAVLAPSWLPWRERIRPGDLTPGDILPVDEDDVRLVPGYFSGEDGEPTQSRMSARALGDEVGLGRQRVLSVQGRDQAAQRWYAGSGGPDSPFAQSAPGRCGNCGFLVRLAGPLSTMFGVCANAQANDDARVVSFDHGCGAHSQAQLRRKQLPPPMADHVWDTLTRDFEMF